MRIFDIIFSIFGLITLAPIFCIITLILFFDSRSPIFSQKRIGKNENIFKVYKFRTMVSGTGNCGTHLVDPNSITPLGNMLRRTKLDELPQLWNILKGKCLLWAPALVC